MQEQQDREDSLLNYYKKLVALRKDPLYKETIVYGDFVPCEDCGSGVIAYLRKSAAQTILVAGNFNPGQITAELPRKADGTVYTAGKLLLGNGKDAAVANGSVSIEGFGAAVLLLEDR